MERWVAKVIAFFLIFILMTISGLLPIKVASWYHKKGAKGDYYISVLNCFGGGVFFGTYLMHMAPEVREILEEKLLIPNHIIYPIPELMIGVGFFFLLFVDKIVTIISHWGNKNKVEADSTAGYVNGGVELKSHLSLKEIHNTPPPSPRLNVTSPHHKSQTSVDASNTELKQNGSAVTNNVKEKPKDAESSISEAGETDELAARPYIFLVALSIDCIFEGMSLGLQDTTSGVWLLVIAILSHELVICFSFGLRIVKLFSTKKVAILIVSYAATIPIGIAIGLAIFETAGGASDEVDIVSGFFQAMSAGIFIYVSFLEILNEELSHDTLISKAVAVAMGFLFMALMVLVDKLEADEPDPEATTESLQEAFRAIVPIKS